jgi:hypothetical protein
MKNTNLPKPPPPPPDRLIRDYFPPLRINDGDKIPEQPKWFVFFIGFIITPIVLITILLAYIYS